MLARSMSPKRISAIQRREAAIHEAGHVVIGRHVGRQLDCLDPVARIIRNDSGDLDERVWWGVTQFYNIERLNSLERRMIACAGAAAVSIWRGREFHLDQWENPDFMGALTDWILAECKPGQPGKLCGIATDRLRRLLSKKRRLWKDLVLHARQLIIEARSIEAN
jgi:hypothetical protein